MLCFSLDVVADEGSWAQGGMHSADCAMHIVSGSMGHLQPWP